MSDKELLELAAKAAGIEHGGWIDYHPRFHNGCFLVKGSPWNPLADDGDALRLAVRLNLFKGDNAAFSALGSTEEAYAATRRAIVRAAAEIGKAMP